MFRFVINMTVQIWFMNMFFPDEILIVVSKIQLSLIYATLHNLKR